MDFNEIEEYVEETTESIKSTIQKILTLAQETCFNVDEAVEDLRGLIDQRNMKEFCKEFIHCLKCCLAGAENYRTNQLVEFIASFISSLRDSNDQETVLEEVLLFLTSSAKVNSDLVRYRTLDILVKYLDSSQQRRSSNGYLNEKLFLKIQSVLVEAMHESNVNIQKLALHAAKYFQMPLDKYCPVINCYMKLLRIESLTEIRVRILDYMVLNDTTLELIKSRLIFDSDIEFLRKLIQKVVINKLPAKNISTRFNRNVIDAIFRVENSDMLLNNYVEKMISFHKSVVTFIEFLDLRDQWYREATVSLGEMQYKDEKLLRIMSSVFSICAESHRLKSKLDPIDQLVCMGELHNLNLSKAFLFRTYSKLVASSFAKESNLDLERYLMQIEESKTDLLVVYQLIDVINLLPDTELDRDYVMNRLIGIVNEEAEFDDAGTDEENTMDNYFIYELILDKFDRFDLDYFNVCYKYDLSDDDAKVLKALKIYSVLLASMTSSDFDKLPLEIDGMNRVEIVIQNIVLGHIRSVNPKIRVSTVRCLALASLLSVDLAMSFTNLFSNIVSIDYPTIVVEALQALFNIILYYPNMIDFKTDSDWIDILSMLERQLGCQNINILYTACSGFAKLLMRHNCFIPNKHTVLTKLLLLYLVEKSSQDLKSKEDSDEINTKKLSACLFHFFNHFIDSRNPSSQANIDTLTKLAVPIIKHSMSRGYPMQSIRRVAKFFYEATSGFVQADFYDETTKSCTKTNNARLQLIVLILDEVIQDDDFILIQKWIECLIEFYVHEWDVCDIDMENDRLMLKSINYLEQIANLIQELINKFKTERWKMVRAVEVKSILSRTKNLASKFSKQTKARPSDNQVMIKDQPIDDDCQTPKKQRLIRID